MPSCPFCTARINSLLEDSVSSTEVRLDASRSFQQIGGTTENEVQGYTCPACGSRIFDDKAEAVAFLSH